MNRPTLDRKQFDAARRYLLEQARPLEAARFRCHFEDAHHSVAIDELAAFQNEDGGFGNALEPDLRAPESSAICTSVAYQILREVGAGHSLLMADRALEYLLLACDPRTKGWRIVPESAEASPHAPWWSQTGREHGYDEFSLNPTAELLGVLYERRDLLNPEALEVITRAVQKGLAVPGDLEMHDLQCCLRLHRTPDMPDELTRSLGAKITGSVHGTVARDPEAWARYALRPLQVVDGPTSPFLPGLEGAVERNLEYEIETQQPDGSWSPTWTWGDAYPDIWPIARREWAGILTLRSLLTLQRFERIEGQ